MNVEHLQLVYNYEDIRDMAELIMQGKVSDETAKVDRIRIALSFMTLASTGERDRAIDIGQKIHRQAPDVGEYISEILVQSIFTTTHPLEPKKFGRMMVAPVLVETQSNADIDTDLPHAISLASGCGDRLLVLPRLILPEQLDVVSTHKSTELIYTSLEGCIETARSMLPSPELVSLDSDADEHLTALASGFVICIETLDDAEEILTPSPLGRWDRWVSENTKVLSDHFSVHPDKVHLLQPMRPDMAAHSAESLYEVLNSELEAKKSPLH